MKLRLVSQGFIFVVLFTIIQCEITEQNVEIDKNEYSKSSHHVLQNGRIISKFVEKSMPIDQQRTLQLDETDRAIPKFTARGDILVPNEEIEHSDSKGINRLKRKVIAETNRFGSSNRWPNGVVPYEFISGIDYRVQQNVLNAFQHWHKRTCIRFEPYNQQRHRNIGGKIIIEDTGSGCATFVGYRPSYTGSVSSYSVYLPLQCPYGSAIHELGHVIGYYHEMARTDRDQEIVLYFNAMSNSEATQYDIMPNPMPAYYGQPYDLGSIMHYFPTDVMAPRDNRRTFLVGQRVGLSFLDGKLANLAYRCGDKCTSDIVCQNEGYVNQFCQCTCPDGFYGDLCNQLQGDSDSSRVLPQAVTPSTSIEVPKPQATTATMITETSNSTSIRWLDWSNWSNCSESCGTGVHVRTRLCSSTAIEGSSEPCSSLGGDSFEIESCQNSGCNQNDVIMSCTFDLADEKCPWENKNNWQIKKATDGGKTGPISDHTRGDGKYIIIMDNTKQFDDSQKLQLGPFTHSTSSNETNHCLQFWYSMPGQGVGNLRLLHSKANDNQTDGSLTFNWKGQGTNWEQVQRTIPNDVDYELVFTYQSLTPDSHHVAIDDISITNGACVSKNINNQRRRKRRQANNGCSRVIDLSLTKTIATITSPDYPNLYPANSQCYYYIRAPKSYRIILQFSDFNLPTSNSNSCGDTVEVRYYHIGQPGPQYCGSGANTNNLKFVSTKNTIMIIFRSDQNYSGRGFRAQVAVAQ